MNCIADFLKIDLQFDYRHCGRVNEFEGGLTFHEGLQLVAESLHLLYLYLFVLLHVEPHYCEVDIALLYGQSARHGSVHLYPHV